MSPLKTDVVVLGAGPGGYAAAFYAADKGKKVILVERDARLGGECLNHGCIPSKALLHAAELIQEAKDSGFRGIHFAPPKIDLPKMRQWKESVLSKLGQGIESLAGRRGVEVVRGSGRFESSKTLSVQTEKGPQLIEFDQAIIATGSKPAIPNDFNLGDDRVMTSEQALQLQDVPQDLLIVGGGYIGMEMGTVYAALGSRITVVEALKNILTGADPDLVRYVAQYAKDHFKEVRLNTKVLKIEKEASKIKVTFQAEGQSSTSELYDRVLVAVGRRPSVKDLGLEKTKVKQDPKGFIQVNDMQQTGDPHIYAIGDVAGGALLAHKAAKEAKVAVEAMTGEKASMKHVMIPAVVFTNPELAWCGLTETEAKASGKTVQAIRYPWGASGRALTLDRTDGLTKLVVDPKTEKILGVGIVGRGAGELISEGVLAIQMGATVKDLGRTVHPHPTLSETLMESAEAFYGHATHTLGRRKSREEIKS